MGSSNLARPRPVLGKLDVTNAAGERSRRLAESPISVLLIDPGGELGGAERVLDTIARRVEPSRFRPVIACLGEGSWPASLAHDGFVVKVIPRGRLREMRTVLKVVTDLTALIRRERVAIVHASLASAIIYGAVAGRLGRARVVWHLHDPQGTQGVRRRVFLRIILSFGADHVIFGNPAAERGWREILDGKRIPTSTILPGVDPEPIAAGDGARARALLGIPDEALVVSMFARAVHYKGHTDLIRAAAIVNQQLPSCRFVICTGWTEDSSDVDEFRQLARELGLDETVLIPGGVSEEVKLGLLRTSRVIAHPSWFEPYGLAILEGMAAGKPVVAARSEGAGFLIDDGVSGLIVPPQDPESLAAALTSLLSDAVRCDEMGGEARKRSAALTNDAMVTAVEEVWRKCLSG